MEFVHVANVADVVSGQILPIEAKGEKLLLTEVNGQYFAAQSKCPHMGHNLCKGHIEGQSVVCRSHKAKFDLVTGAVERDPKLLFIKMKAKSTLTTYPVKVEDDSILVGI